LRLNITIAGLTLLAVGLLVLLYGASTFPISTYKIETGTLFSATFEVHDYRTFNARMEKNVTVSGQASASLKTGDPSDINFLVMDERNFKKWERREGDTHVYFAKYKVGQLNFSFVTDHDDLYYFVFDNTYSDYKKIVTFNASFQRTVVKQEPRYALNYVGGVICALAAIVVLYGLFKEPEIRWA
jgi:hypothetical protein